MSAIETSIKDIIKILREEALKEYREYDTQSRPLAVYQANTLSMDGEACLKTEYVYDGFSNRLLKKKESVVPWLSAWDI